MTTPINIIFDGPPGPKSGRFVEVETDDGKSKKVGEWIDKGDGYWALRITAHDLLSIHCQVCDWTGTTANLTAPRSADEPGCPVCGGTNFL